MEREFRGPLGMTQVTDRAAHLVVLYPESPTVLQMAIIILEH